MKKLLQNMSLVDWLLVGLFVLLMALLVNNVMPPYGWIIGVIIALGLLYLAKRRRDRLQQGTGSEDRK